MPCCCTSTVAPEAADPAWVTGYVETPAGRVPRASTQPTWPDRLGAWAVRWCIARNSYRVAPGLYALGSPASDSPLLVTANYKMSFDHLRAAMDGLDAWVLVLDTKGINVWCAAGKGTFGTGELIARIEQTGAARVVAHRTVVLPQLGAPGVAAHEVTRATGFRVVYGPVRAADLPAFLRAGMQATTAMRRASFNLSDRLAVVPVQLVQGLWGTALATALLCLGDGLRHGGRGGAASAWPHLAGTVWAVYIGGTVLTPALLPWLPGRALAAKGAVTGLLMALVLVGTGSSVGLALLAVAACSLFGLLFTGSTTYTSVSGVRRELRLALPAQALLASAGVLLWFLEHTP